MSCGAGGTTFQRSALSPDPGFDINPAMDLLWITSAMQICLVCNAVLLPDTIPWFSYLMLMARGLFSAQADSTHMKGIPKHSACSW
jgi:hypothetical protein